MGEITISDSAYDPNQLDWNVWINVPYQWFRNSSDFLAKLIGNFLYVVSTEINVVPDSLTRIKKAKKEAVIYEDQSLMYTINMKNRQTVWSCPSLLFVLLSSSNSKGMGLEMSLT